MRYTAVESQVFPLSSRVTFVDLGYLYGEKGSTFVHHDCGGKLGEALKDGTEQTPAPLLDATDIVLDHWELRQQATDIFKELFPYSEDQSHYSDTLTAYLKALYVLMGPGLDQKVDCVFCCVDPADDVPLVNVSRKLGIKCINILDTKTLYRIQDYAMDNTLQF